jgi:hypothetical protein
MWNYETGHQLHSVELNLGHLPRSVYSLGYQANSIDLSEDGKRILVTFAEQVFDPESNEQRVLGSRAFMVVDLELKEAFGLPRLVDRREFFPDRNLTRALVRSEASNDLYEIWEFRTASVVGSFTSGRTSAGGVLAGPFGSFVRFQDPIFSSDNQMIATASSEGVAFWDLSNLSPGLGFRRDGNGLSLVWDEQLTDDLDLLQMRGSVISGDWQDLDKGDSGELKIETDAGIEQYYRWRP